MRITKAPLTKVEVNIFRHGDNIYIDLNQEQYMISLSELNKLEDMDKRSTETEGRKLVH